MNYNIRRDNDAPPPNDPQHTPFAPQAAAAESSWERQTLRELLLSAQQEQRRARLWRNIWRGVGVMMVLSVLVSMRSCGSAGSEGKSVSGDHTAMIELNGEIGGGYQDQVAMLRDSLEAAYKNKQVKGIIIRANSPGGSPVVSNTAFAEVRRLKAMHPKVPVYVVAEDMCASGCYYIAAAADKIYADPSSLVGSIGVIGGGFDFTGLMDKLGIKRRLRTAGDNKGMGDPFSPETPEQQAIWQAMLKDIHSEFIQAVKTGRGNRLLDKQYPDVFSGRIYTGLEAKKVGLVDDFGNIYSVARDVVQAPEIVDYTVQDENFSKLISRRLGSEMEQSVRRVIEEKGW